MEETPRFPSPVLAAARSQGYAAQPAHPADPQRGIREFALFRADTMPEICLELDNLLSKLSSTCKNPAELDKSKKCKFSANALEYMVIFAF